MLMTTVSSYDPSWDFNPRQKLSKLLPAWALDGHLLSGFDLGPQHPVQNMKVSSAEEASDLLKAIYPELSWPEIVRLLDQPDTDKYFNAEHLMAAYGYNWDDHWQRISDLLITWPLEIQNFVSNKDLRPFDLTVLMSLPLPVQIPLLKKLVTLELSKSLFCQILELAGECLLLGTSADEICHILSRSNPLNELKKLRFPVTFAGDGIFKEKIEKYSWPKGVQAQCQRRGDTLGVEFKFFAKNREELLKTLKNIEFSSEPWKESL
jgi:hypothetical protein